MSANKKPKFISIQDLIYSLGLLEEDVLKWIKRDNPEITKDHRGQTSVPLEFLERYSKSEEYDIAFKKAVATNRKILTGDSSETNNNLKAQRLKLLDKYEYYIRELENIHHKYIHIANSEGHESKMMAAYLLFGRVIDTLKLCCLAQKNDYWYWLSLLREINEHLGVAEYFAIHGDTPEGKDNLFTWYRHNEVLGNSLVRTIHSKHMSAINDTFSESENQGLLNELYQKKSKFTHPTYLIIREITPYSTLQNGQLIIEHQESCRYQRKHFECTVEFKQHILTSFLSFRQCFHNSSLEEEDLKTLYDISQKLSKEEIFVFYKNDYI